jgi:hypothetical protein
MVSQENGDKEARKEGRKGDGGGRKVTGKAQKKKGGMNVDIGASKQAKQFKQASDNRPAPPGSPTEAAV